MILPAAGPDSIPSRAGRWAEVVPGLLVVVLLAGCGASIPTDPDGTLQRVQDTEVLRAGASPSPGRVEVDDGRDSPSGPEVDLVEGFADELGADVEWTVAGEEHVVAMLDRGELDLAVGGFSEDNGWAAEVGLTRPYAEVDGPAGERALVMMVPMGENALQSALERWLDRQQARP